MAVSTELQLVAKIADVGQIHPVLDAGITVDKFIDQDARLIFEYLRKYWKSKATRGNIPTRDLLADKFPTVDLPPPDRLTLSAIIEEFLTKDIKARLQKLSEHITDWSDKPEEVLAHIEGEVQDMLRKTRATTDIVVSDAAKDIAQRYEDSKNKDIMRGIPYPWEVLNAETQGMRDGEFIIFYGRPKCVVAGQRVMGPSGELVPIETPPEKVPTTVGQKLNWGNCTGTYAGKKNAVRITTRSGHVIDVGEDHPFLVPDMTFRAAKDLSVGAYVGVARNLPETTPAADALNIEEAALLGYLVGDGNYTRNEVQFTKSDTGVITEVARLANILGATLHQPSGCRDIEYRIICKEGRVNPVLELLRRTGCHGQKGPDKHVPKQLFCSSKQAIAAFLSGYTDTDGSVDKRTVSWCSASYALIRDIKHLLLRFGITGLISEVDTNYGTKAWVLSVTAQEQHVLLQDTLTLSNVHKAKALRDLAEADIRRKRHDDGIPYSDLLMNEILSAKGDKEWKYLRSGFSRGKLFRRTGKVSRHLLRQLADHIDAPSLLEWANSDIRWESILSIEYLGSKECYDITMSSGEPVFVVEDFITHNSLKTWLGLYICTNAYEVSSQRVLVYTREMSPEQMMDRSICLLIGAPYEAFRKGYLHKIPHPMGGNMEDAFHGLLDSMHQDEKTCTLETGYNKSLIITSDREDPNGGGVNGLRRKVEDYKPDLIFVDAMYLMRNDRSSKRSIKWSEQSAISQDLKEIAQDFKRPVIGTLQANRGAEQEEKRGGTTSNLAYSDSYAQDCDLAVEVIKKYIDKEHNQLALAITASREVNMVGFAINGNPGNDLGMLMRPVVDDYGKPIGVNGGAAMEPIIFRDVRDIQKMFKVTADITSPDRAAPNAPYTPNGKHQGPNVLPAAMKARNVLM